MIIDQAERTEALDITQSFIVQAPAGSGKTELLIQRYLALLAQVEHAPEQIVAITFTRKAAHEMHARILQALTLAKHGSVPTDPHKRITYELASAVLARDIRSGWELLDSPDRLCIQTIDGFCSQLARQLPLLSGFGALPKIAEDARDLYLQAAKKMWFNISTQENWSRSIKNLMYHLDNQLPKLYNLIAGLLARREQWLDYISIGQNADQLQKMLEKHLHNLIIDVLQQAHREFPPHLQNELLALLHYAREQVIQEGVDNDKLKNVISTFPAVDTHALEQWKTLTHLLLTNEGEIRKRLDKNIGFPAKTSAKTPEEKLHREQRKETMLSFLEELSKYPLLVSALQAVHQLPYSTYPFYQQQLIVDLLEVLSLAAAQLMLIFQQEGTCDFNQLLLGALQALGSSEQPSDLALAMDYRLQHILIDEFQDTSVAQFRLLERLTTGWSAEDGRTLFLVGDPMQSIYRFRQAEVGLFLAVSQQGVGHIPLKPLTLQVNFRSAQTIVEWINQRMLAVFPAYADISVGAVPFKPAVAFHVNSTAQVEMHCLTDSEQEANKVLSLLKERLTTDESLTVAILVRTRNQLPPILKLLQAQAIEYHAVEIELLASRPVLQDLLALTRALLHPADRIAWLACLRSPLCGLTMNDLTVLTRDSPTKSLISCLYDMQDISELSDHAQHKWPTLMNILQTALEERQRLPVAQWIFNTWLLLGGNKVYLEPTANDDAQLFFNLLEEMGFAVNDLSPEQMQSRVERLFATAKNPQARVQIMTMHKAKGLEFDTVIIPGLQGSTRPDQKPLLNWWERTRAQGQAEILLAPLPATDETQDKLYDYIWTQQQCAANLEATRLLYVALTRAKTHLYLLGVQQENESPPANSLLAKLL